MSHHDRTRRYIGGLVLFGALGAGALALASGNHRPAEAAAAPVPQALVTCSSATKTCASWSNPSAGGAISGKSTAGIGVQGISTGNYGVAGSSVTNFGVVGYTPSTAGQSAAGVAGYGGSTGLYGESTSGAGVYGQDDSSTGNGVVGSAQVGVLGFTSSPTGFGVLGEGNGAGAGVYGGGRNSTGVYGYSDAASGVQADSASGPGLYATSGTGYGIVATTGGSTAIYARNSAGNGSDIQGSYLGIIGRAPAGTHAYPLSLTDTNSNDLFYVNGDGDVYYKGSLSQFARTATGMKVAAFSAKMSSPTVEDSGTARLVNGVATVPLDATFASSIDPRDSYRVFVTPDGDTRGLFVATKTPRGFIVRESQGGRSNVDFDYRILATSIGEAGKRMGLAIDATAPRAPSVDVPQPKRFAPPKLPPARRITLHAFGAPRTPGSLGAGQ